MTACPASSSGAGEEMAPPRPLKGLAGLLAMGIPTLFVLALPLSVLVLLFGFLGNEVEDLCATHGITRLAALVAGAAVGTAPQVSPA